MAEEKAKQIGKFTYVEPNNINLDKADNAIPQPYENYSMAVNLQVELPHRYEGIKDMMTFSSENGTISFFEGSGGGFDSEGNFKQGYLSTNWTDIAATNVDKGNKECLGVESINISYNSNFFPVVNIRFVDVRGASLFMPEEKAMIDSLNGEKTSFAKIDGGSFFKALFSCPSPIFKLTIKGFYGKQATYKLVWSKFNAEFDSNNGNFITNIEFIGYMYGVYTDLPMSFVAIAPYIYDGGDYGGINSYWNSQIENGRFYFKAEDTYGNVKSVKMLTIPEFIESVGTVIKKEDKIPYSTETGKEHRENDAINKALSDLRSGFPFKRNGWEAITEEDGLTKFVVHKIKGGETFLPYEVEDICNYYRKIKEYNNDYGDVFKKYLDDFQDMFEQLNAKIQKYGGEIENEKSIENFVKGKRFTAKGAYDNTYAKKSDYGDTLLVKTIYPNYTVTRNPSPTENKDVYSAKNEITGEEVDVSFIETNLMNEKKIETLFSKGITKVYFYAVQSKFDEYLKTDFANTEKNDEKFQEDIKAQRLQRVNSLIGFNLSIENIFRMIFAHIETFMHFYYNVCLNNIRNIHRNDRKISELNIKEDALLDVTKNIFESGYLPPFATFLEDGDDNKRQLAWPEKVLNNNGNLVTLDETKFINAIIGGVKMYGDAVKQAMNTINKTATEGQTSDSIDTFIPTTLFDLVNNNNPINPYTEIKQYIEGKNYNLLEVKNKIAFTFVMRMYYMAMIYKITRVLRAGTVFGTYKDNEIASHKGGSNLFSDKGEWCEYFGKVEAINIRKAFGEDISESLRTILVSGLTENEFTGMLKELFGDLTTANLKVSDPENSEWKTLEMKYPSIVKDNKYMFLPLRYFSKERLDKDGNDIDKLHDSDNYVAIRLDGEEISDEILNSKSFRIINNLTYFDDIKKNIEKESFYGLEPPKKDLLNTLFNRYLGSEFWSNDKTPKEKEGKVKDENDKFESPYVVDNKMCKDYKGTRKDIFYNVESDVNGKILNATPIDFKKATTLFPEKVVLAQPVTSMADWNNDIDSYSYMSFFNGKKTKDAINDIIYYFTANVGDKLDTKLKAYLFLFTLPINKKYAKYAIQSNGKIVAKSVLLREGAQYWWEENYRSYGIYLANNTKWADGKHVPIEKNNSIENSQAPTFNLKETTQSTSEEYLTWYELIGYESENELKKLVSSSRKEYLKNYFVEWANTEFNEFNNFIGNSHVDEQLTPDGNASQHDSNEMSYGPQKRKAISKLYLDRVITVDYASIIKRCLGKDDTFLTWLTTDLTPDQVRQENYHFLSYGYKQLINSLQTIYNPKTVIINNSERQTGYETDTNYDFRLSLYITLQTLYNKFLCGASFDRWVLDKDGSDFNNFIFMDSCYNDISQKLIMNGELLSEEFQKLTPSINPTTEGVIDVKKSVFEFLSYIDQKHNINLWALPINPMFLKIDEVFQAKSFAETFNVPVDTTLGGMDECWASVYAYQPSTHLDTGGSVPDDGFSILDPPIPFKSFDKNDGRNIPAFGVTYAKQNQSFFKNINLSTYNPQNTEASITAQLNIAARGDEGPRETTLYGQDLYKVYSNYSYRCEVEMMGCAQIMPLMYFQLNNIPLWKGAYLIYTVEHNLVAGNMTTKFTGYRVSKAQIPFTKADLIFIDENGKGYHVGNGENDEYLTGTSIEEKGTYTTEGPSTTFSGIPINDSDVTETNPIVCLTPAHYPKHKDKSREFRWSARVVQEIAKILQSQGYNVWVCNQDWIGGSTKKKYVMTEAKNIVKKYGSQRVISVVPHWNGAGGNYYASLKNKEGATTREDSKLLCNIFVEEALKVKEKRNTYTEMPRGMMNGDCKVVHLGEKNTDEAPTLNCACVLTENWFADYRPAGEPYLPWQGAEWLEKQGFDIIVNMHVNAIKRYIDTLKK